MEELKDPDVYRPRLQREDISRKFCVQVLPLAARGEQGIVQGEHGGPRACCKDEEWLEP